MVQKNFFIRVIMMLCLFWAGASRAWAYDFEIKGVQYSTWTSYNGSKNAVVTGYTGTAETLTIPEYVSNGSTTYKVGQIKNGSGDAPVDISSVKKLIFEGYVYLNGNSSNPTFTCPALTDIVFKGGSPTLYDSFSKYFGTRTGITAHVTDKTDEEIETLKTSTAVWSDFADIVLYNEAESETVNVYVTVEMASFEGSTSAETITTGSTQTAVYEHNMHMNYTFTIDPDFSSSMYTIDNVYVNGKDVTSELTDVNGKKQFTVEDLRDNVYIRVVGGRKNAYLAISTNIGGTISWDGFTISNRTSIGTMNKSEGKAFTITPNEGYELDRCWLHGWNVSEQYPEYLVSNSDGTYTLTIPSLDVDETTLTVAFKEKSGSGSGTTTGFDLNGDGNVDVSDIDKLIEEINKQ